LTSGVNNYNYFPENQLTKFRAVETVKVNRDQNFPPPGCFGYYWARNQDVKVVEKRTLPEEFGTVSMWIIFRNY